MNPLTRVAQTFGLLVRSDIFMPFALPYMNQRRERGLLWAGLCPMGVVEFIFRS
jgi:uncharacterized protein (DUF486 family)